MLAPPFSSEFPDEEVRNGFPNHVDQSEFVVVLAGVAIVAVSAKADPPNTGMADPSAMVSAFDHFAAGGAPANVVILSLSNLRGVSSEAVNAGGRVTVDLATGTVGVIR